MRLLTWLDWFNIATFLPISDPRASQAAPQLTQEDLRLAIHCLTPDGSIHRGARCLRHLGARMPLLWPAAMLLWVPGVIGCAEVAYNFISRRRYVLSRLFGCKQACSLLPVRPRQGASGIENEPLLTEKQPPA